jgi:hypothetical protein
LWGVSSKKILIKILIGFYYLRTIKELILVYLVRKYASRANISMFKHFHIAEIKTSLKTAEIEYKVGRENEFIEQVVKSCLVQYF